jgi:hypothetical protein
MSLRCGEEADPGHYLWLQTLYFLDGQLMLTALTASACVTSSPTPIPFARGEMCELVYNTIPLNLSAYNRGIGGWTANVNVTGDGSGNAVLYYQPCQGMPCPEGAQCEGDDQGTVWLCQERECVGYGLFEHDLTAHGVEVEDPYVQIIYKGDRHREAIVDFYHDHRVQDDTVLTLPSEVRLDGTRLRFRVGTDKSFILPPRRVRGAVGYGAIFLIVVAALTLLYFGMGVVGLWLRTGRMVIPNARFWDGVWLSLHTGIVALCSCCSTTPQKARLM